MTIRLFKKLLRVEIYRDNILYKIDLKSIIVALFKEGIYELNKK
ncbi:hypothetical protein [Peptoniphilus asaccharolyticus]|nr:hypothetical protein [Peptoniphilus asaccharolyticus]